MNLYQKTLTHLAALIVTVILVMITCPLYLAPRLALTRNAQLPPVWSSPNSNRSSANASALPPECPSGRAGAHHKSEYFLDLSGCYTGTQGLAAANAEKVILAWTLSYDVSKWFGLESDADFARVLRGSGCTFTRDKSLVSKADMLLFHSCFQNATGFYYPKQRTASQLYVYLTTEAPTSWYCKNGFMPADGIFNVTATYKTDSDVVFSYSPKLRTKSEIDTSVINRAAKKTSLAFWYVSDCKNDWFSQRQQYVIDLKKYMSVDVYGSCGSHFSDSQPSCPKSDDSQMDECFLSQSRKYKFYLSFENAICKDYITEKLFKVLQPLSDVVPVVLGPSVADYEKVAPRGSFIHVKNFSSPEALATYLKYLDGNDEAYNAYHAWRSTFYYDPIPGRNSLDQHPPSQLRRLCRLAHNPPRPKVWDRLLAWYSIEDNCHNVENVCAEYGICHP